MNQTTRQHLDNLQSKNPDKRYASFQYIMEQTEKPVDWAYEAWTELLALLENGDNHERSIAAQVLSNLAKSDPEGRLLNDYDKLLAVTKDERFVTARHALQSLWNVGIVNKDLQQKVIETLRKRFLECTSEKNCTLIRYDILQVFRKIYDSVPDEQLKATVLKLIETEDDKKYRKKYSGLWIDLLKENKG